MAAPGAGGRAVLGPVGRRQCAYSKRPQVDRGCRRRPPGSGPRRDPAQRLQPDQAASGRRGGRTIGLSWPAADGRSTVDAPLLAAQADETVVASGCSRRRSGNCRSAAAGRGSPGSAGGQRHRVPARLRRPPAARSPRRFLPALVDLLAIGPAAVGVRRVVALDRARPGSRLVLQTAAGTRRRSRHC